jgi:hypothetical protein
MVLRFLTIGADHFKGGGSAIKMVGKNSHIISVF